MTRFLVRWCSAFMLLLVAASADSCTVAYSAPRIEWIRIHPKHPNVLYVVTTSGLYESRNRGDSWTEVPGAQGSSIWAIALDPQDADRFYVAGGLAQGPGLYVTANGGRSFQRTSLGEQAGRVVALVVDPRNPSRLVAGSSDGMIFTSTDGTQSWRMTYSGVREVIRSLAFADQNTVFAGVRSGLMISRDAGQTWTKHSDNLAIEELATVPGERLFGVLAGSLYRSDDSGKGFYRVAECRKFAVAQSDPKVMFAACGQPDMCFGMMSLKRSTDAGRSWEPMAGPVGWSIAVDPSDANVIYAAFGLGGLYRTRDGGKSWQWADRGIAGPQWEKQRTEFTEFGIK